jgi:hypothetical protein
MKENAVTEIWKMKLTGVFLCDYHTERFHLIIDVVPIVFNVVIEIYLKNAVIGVEKWRQKIIWHFLVCI